MNTSRAPRPAAAARGFTLVELLVVIGIIAILVAILIPALGAVRANAKAVVCLSNVRQIAHAAQAYAVDNKVYVGFDKNVAPNLDRKAALYPYLQQGKNNAENKAKSIWNCPSNDRIEQEASYGFNTNLNWMGVGRIKRWAETVALCDGGLSVPDPKTLKDDPNFKLVPSLSTHLWAPGKAFSTSACYPNPLRHPRQTVSVGYTDGHAERMELKPPFYPGPIGSPEFVAQVGNGIKDVNDPKYTDTLWDLN
jgi:prepilin-type N-terminal cleavage/methylation domain-containing protein